MRVFTNYNSDIKTNFCNDFNFIEFINYIVLGLLLFGLTSCGDDDSSLPEPYFYTMPEQRNDGWQVGHIEDVGIDGTLFTEMMDNIRQGDPGFRLK